MAEATPPSRGLRIFGFPLKISPFFVVLVFLLGALPHLGSEQDFGLRTWTGILIWVFVVTFSVLWHELGHAFMIRRFGHRAQIELHGMGGTTRWAFGSKPDWKQRLAVSLAGPIAGFVLALFLSALYLPFSMGLRMEMPWAITHTFELFLLVNVIWGALNLLPLLPWDGGQALFALLDRATDGKGLRPTGFISIGLGGVVAVLAAVYLRHLWPVLLASMSVLAGFRAVAASKLIARAQEQAKSTPQAQRPLNSIQNVDRVLESLWEDLTTRGSAERLIGAVLRGSEGAHWRQNAEQVESQLAVSTDPQKRASALELAGWMWLLAGDVEGANRVAAAMRPKHEPSVALAAALAARAGRFDEVLRLAEELDNDALASRARLTSFALVKTGRFAEAVERYRELCPTDEEGAFLVETLFLDRRFEPAAKLAAELFERFGRGVDAYNCACCHAALNETDEAFAWIHKAIDAGYEERKEFENDPDLAALRAHPEWKHVEERLSRSASSGG